MGNEAEERTEQAVEPPGQRLRAARESAGMSQSDVAGELRLGVDTIDALERDAVERLPAPIFVRGYLRNYALLLGLPAQELTQAYDASIGRGQAQGLMAGPIQQPLVGARRRNYLVWLLVLAAALAAAWWFQRDVTLSDERAVDTQEASPGATQAEVAPAEETEPYVLEAAPERDLPPAAEPVTPPPDDVPDAAPVAPVQTPALAQQAPPPITATGSEPSGEAQAPAAVSRDTESASAPAAQPASAAGGDTLTLVFQDRSWVEVRDARGERLLYRLADAGESRTVQGRAPFRLVLGNAPAVRVELNGSEVDVATHTRGRTARFSVAP